MAIRLTKSKKVLLGLVSLLVTVALATLVALPVQAQGLIFDPDQNDGLGAIELPTFFDLDQVQSFSVFSYVAVFLSLFFVGIAVLWVVLAIRASFDWLRSEGDESMIGESKKRFSNVFASITILFVFFIALQLVASFIGLGTIFSWPRQFSICSDGKSYLFQLQLEVSGTERDADSECFGN